MRCSSPHWRCDLMMKLPPQVNTAFEMLEAAGYEAYLVGGAVRDYVRDNSPAKDWDITTNALPEQVEEIFTGYHLIETGLKHGTVTVVIDQEPLEITTYRVDGDYSDHRHPDSVSFTRSLKDDLERRDFTMNALAYNPRTGVVDFVGGKADIAGDLVRCVGDPDRRFQEDPWGVKLTAKNITPSGLTIVCTQQDGEPTGELQTGSYYGLEMLQDGEWVAVELLPMEYELAWTSEAWMIPNNAETEWEVNWSRLYGELPAGSYRISKSVMDFRGTGDYDTKTYYAGFDLVDAADTSNVSYEHGGFGVSVPLLSGWEYKVEEYSADGMSYGVSFRPAGEDGWIDFQYWPTFGVCGTGLSMKEFGNGSMGTYDGGAIWNFISYPASKGNFVATTQGVNSWWSRYGETAMEIITQVICTDTIVD